MQQRRRVFLFCRSAQRQTQQQQQCLLHHRRCFVSSHADSQQQKSPFQVFVDTFKQELKKSQEFQESVKALQDEGGKIGESEAFRRAKGAYSKAKEGSDAASTRGGEAVRRAASSIGTGAAAAWDSKAGKLSRQAITKTGTALHSATEPIRQNKVYKSVSGSVKEVIDEGSSSRYGGYLEKEERKMARQKYEERQSKSPAANKPTVENQEAGESVVLHKDSAWRESWSKFKDNNSLMQSLFSMKRSLDDSDNPLVNATRTIADKVSGFFAENETAQVVRLFREMDPNFQIEPFLRELREYVFPEIVDAYVKGDQHVLKLWLGEAPFQVWSAMSKQYTEQGLVPDGKVLDIRGVDIVSARIIPETEVPVFVVACRSQEVHLYRHAKTGELAAGVEDRIQQCTYAAVITRIADEVQNQETKGYRIIDFARGHTRDYH